MLPAVSNLLSAAPSPGSAEETHPLLQATGLQLEHLISHGQPSPPEFWYDQPNPEWVLLLRGTATLDFGGAGSLDLRAGDGLTIPAHAKHQVDKVSDDAVWVALHFTSETPGKI